MLGDCPAGLCPPQDFIMSYPQNENGRGGAGGQKLVGFVIPKKIYILTEHFIMKSCTDFVIVKLNMKKIYQVNFLKNLLI